MLNGWISLNMEAQIGMIILFRSRMAAFLFYLHEERIKSINLLNHELICSGVNAINSKRFSKLPYFFTRCRTPFPEVLLFVQHDVVLHTDLTII